MSGRRILELGACGRIPADSLFELYLETRDDHMITLYQTRSAMTLGSWVYDGAVVLARYIEAFVIHKDDKMADISDKTVIELGAGTGVVGVLMGHYGADVTITDLESLVPLIQYNIEQNGDLLRGRVKAETLCWGEKLGDRFKKSYEIIILANCVYYEGSLEVLVQTMLDMTSDSTVVYACYEERTREIKDLISKWHSIAGEHYDIDDIPREYYRNLGQLDCVRIVKMVKKASIQQRDM